ncbi:MAG: polynucleotide adenylyltransferase PcnB [Proteobacteria bacterium]|nr:polynucleotide adenylyltransferase PcnB [Pseudomonadota bacterium]MCG6935940.1 polynucleotide adenylyltransferase PcnB [Pseudomonadota bacterium]
MPVNRQDYTITKPRIIPRAEHCVSRGDISEAALKVLYRLHKAGYAAYLVGGGVRDLLLGKNPKDFDIATDATPEELRKLFRNCRLIGRRFRLAHIHFGREIIEVATFRGPHGQGEGEGISEEGMILRDNVYGSLEEDAWRRDFTVNALYYNIADYSLVDYTGGLDDIQAGVLRVIGDARTRILEDPVRMLRAARFAAKLNFQLEPGLREVIHELADRLDDVPPARLFDEVLKLFHAGYAQHSYEVLRDLDLFGYLFAQTDDLLAEGDAYTDAFIRQSLINTDTRIHSGKGVNPAFLFAALLWGPVRDEAQLLQEEGMTELQALQTAGNDIIAAQLEQVMIPKRFSFPTREIWTSQARLPRRNGKRASRLMEQPRFRACYDFLLLRCQIGEPLHELCNWWTRFQEVGEEERSIMLRQLGGGKPRSRRHRKSAKAPAGE